MKKGDYATPTSELIDKMNATKNPVTRSVLRDIIAKRFVDEISDEQLDRAIEDGWAMKPLDVPTGKVIKMKLRGDHA